MINSPVDQLLVQVAVRFFFVFGIVGFVVGVGLVADHVRMHQFFGVMDRWVSMRRSTRWLAIPRDIEAQMKTYRRLVGAAFVLLPAFSTYILLVNIDAERMVGALGRHNAPLYVAWLVESARRVLVVGSLLAVAVGILLVFFPQLLPSIESRANHWYSLRTHSQKGDSMNLGFDRWVESHPQLMGGLIAAAALVVVIEYGTRMLAA